MVDRWANSFSAFLEDIGPCPEGYELDREDTDGPYAPGNARWVDRLTQSNNKRRNHRIEVSGETYTVAEAARHFDVPYSTLLSRLRRGASPDDAVRA